MKKPKITVTFIKIRDCKIDSVPDGRGFFWHCPETDDTNGGLYDVIEGEWVLNADTRLAVHKSHLRGVIGTMLEPKYHVISPKSLY